MPTSDYRFGWGRFIVLGSESSFNIPVDMMHYGISKTADVALARGLAKRMAGTGGHGERRAAGADALEDVAEMLEEDRRRTGRSLEEVAAEFVANRPSSIIRRAASVEEVANMIVLSRLAAGIGHHRRRAPDRWRRDRPADVGAPTLFAGKIARP